MHVCFIFSFSRYKSYHNQCLPFFHIGCHFSNLPVSLGRMRFYSRLNLIQAFQGFVLADWTMKASQDVTMPNMEIGTLTKRPTQMLRIPEFYMSRELQVPGVGQDVYAAILGLAYFYLNSSYRSAETTQHLALWAVH